MYLYGSNKPWAPSSVVEHSSFWTDGGMRRLSLLKMYLFAAIGYDLGTEVSNPQPRMAINAAQYKIISLLKTFFCPSVFISLCI